MSKVDESIGAGGGVEGRETRHGSVNGVREDADVSEARAEHPHGLGTTDKDAPMPTNVLEGAEHARLVGQLGLCGKRPGTVDCA